MLFHNDAVPHHFNSISYKDGMGHSVCSKNRLQFELQYNYLNNCYHNYLCNSFKLEQFCMKYIQ